MRAANLLLVLSALLAAGAASAAAPEDPGPVPPNIEPLLAAAFPGYQRDTRRLPDGTEVIQASAAALSPGEAALAVARAARVEHGFARTQWDLFVLRTGAGAPRSVASGTVRPGDLSRAYGLSAQIAANANAQTDGYPPITGVDLSPPPLLDGVRMIGLVTGESLDWGDDRTLGVFSWDGTSLHLVAVFPLRDGTPSSTTVYEWRVLATGAAGFRDLVTSQRCTLEDGNDCYPVSGRPQLWRWDARSAAYARVPKREPELGAIRSSSVLGKSYDPENVGDGRRATAWCEGAKGSGVGEWLEFPLAPGTRVARVGLVPGYDKDRAIWKANGRVRRIRVSPRGAAGVEAPLRDEATMQWIDLPGAPKTEAVRIEILDVFPGARHADTCVSEVQLDLAEERD